MHDRVPQQHDLQRVGRRRRRAQRDGRLAAVAAGPATRWPAGWLRCEVPTTVRVGHRRHVATTTSHRTRHASQGGSPTAWSPPESGLAQWAFDQVVAGRGHAEVAATR